MLGSEFSLCRNFSVFERLYLKVFGMPILGLRIRAWSMLPVIKRHLGNAKCVLDMGSGRGVFTVEMAKNLPDAEVLGVDLIREKVNTANELVNIIRLNNCSFEAVDILEKTFDRRFDSIIAIDVLEHIQDDLGVVKKLHRLLNPGAKLIIHVPHTYRNLFGVKRINFDIEGHVRPGYLLEEVEALLTKANLSIQEKGYTYSSLETLANDLSYVITEGREKRKLIYSIAFPLLLFIAWLGKFTKPSYGSGVFIVGKKMARHNG
jgi:SAM-dependent methyltransferase